MRFMEGVRLFGSNVAALVNTVLLTFVYILGVGMTSFFAKATRKRLYRKGWCDIEKVEHRRQF